MGIADQVRTNLIHYNQWTDVETHVAAETSPIDGSSFCLLSGYPPAKLDQFDIVHQKEWVVGRLMAIRRSNMDELELFFEAVHRLEARPKRITLALVNDDGTVTYYFVHDGVIKPRQN